jgi:hypothetical protein
MKFVTTNARRKLCEGMPKVELKEVGDMTVSYFDGVPFRAYWLTDSEVVFRFRRANDDSIRNQNADSYEELAKPKDWLEYRRPLSKDPKPDLQSASAQVMGRAYFELSQGELKLKPIKEADIKAGAK